MAPSIEFKNAALGAVAKLSTIASATSTATAQAAKSSLNYLKGDAADRESVQALQLCWVSWRLGDPPQPVICVGYAEGWQAWTLGGKGPVELLSRRDASFRCAVLSVPRNSTVLLLLHLAKRTAPS